MQAFTAHLTEGGAATVNLPEGGAVTVNSPEREAVVIHVVPSAATSHPILKMTFHGSGLQLEAFQDVTITIGNAVAEDTVMMDNPE
ncbi:hypothetical protein ACHAQJ_004307 [Trichoderma viride]